MKIIYQLLIIVLIACQACNRQDNSSQDRQHVVKWHDGVALYSVIYSLDDHEIGRGQEAYTRLIAALENLPDRSHVKFLFPLDVEQLLLDQTQEEQPLPFRGHEDEREKFLDIVERKKLVISFSSYRSPVFLK